MHGAHTQDATDVIRGTRTHSPLRAAILASRRALLDRQRDDGHWVGELQGDTILESEYLILLAFLGKHDDPCLPKLANYIRAQQQTDGGWTNYPGGPPDVSVSVKAYFALKIAGDSAIAPHMKQAAEVIRKCGGAEAVQQLHEVLPRAARPDALSQLPGRAAGTGAAAALVLRQHLRDVELDADDPRAAESRLRAQAGDAGTR